MTAKNIFNSVKLEQEELGKFLNKSLKISLETPGLVTSVIGSTKTKLDPICQTKPKVKKL